MADILGQSEVDEAGPVYLVRLEDHTQEQPFDVGQMLVVAAQMKEVWSIDVATPTSLPTIYYALCVCVCVLLADVQVQVEGREIQGEEGVSAASHTH